MKCSCTPTAAAAYWGLHFWRSSLTAPSGSATPTRGSMLESIVSVTSKDAHRQEKGSGLHNGSGTSGSPFAPRLTDRPKRVSQASGVMPSREMWAAPADAAILVPHSGRFE